MPRMCYFLYEDCGCDCLEGAKVIGTASNHAIPTTLAIPVWRESGMGRVNVGDEQAA